MDWIHGIIEHTQFPLLTAFLLGLIVALHPCPLATNIAAMGYIARDVANRRRVFLNGLFYTFGRMIAYSVLGMVLIVVLRNGADMLSLGHWFSEWGERLLAPVLIVIGLYFMLGHLIHRHEHCPDVHSRGHRFHGAGGSMALGLLLALSFCPESAVVYFGMLMPLSVESHGGFMLPVVFSVATAIPTVLMVWAVAYGLAGLSAMKERMHVLQRWVSVGVGALFIGAGVFCLFF